MLKQLFMGASAALAFAAASPAAHAATGPAPSNYTFNFSGKCNDCTGQGTATLTVQNYVLGAMLNSDNLVTFTYSSNLTSYTDNPTLDRGTGTTAVFVDSLSGSINMGANYYRIHVEQDSAGVPTNTFDSYLDGTWNVVSNSPISDGNVPASSRPGVPLDNGTNGLWNGDAGAVSAAPEPGTWALMMLGVGAIGAMLGYRKRIVVDHKAKLAAIG